MARPIAVCTADLHLQRCAWNSRPTLQWDAIFSFHHICELAASYGIPVLAAGDILDVANPDASVIDKLRSGLELLAAADQKFVFIQGQHDRQYPVPWPKAVLPNTAVWPCPGINTFKRMSKHQLDCGLTVGGLDWQTAAKLPSSFQSAENCDILLMHQVCKEFMGERSYEFEFAQCPGGVKLLLIGDYHGTHVRYDVTLPDKRALSVLCPGSTAMQSITEPADKHVFILYDDLTTISHRLPTRALLRHSNVVSEEELAEVCELLPESIDDVRENRDWSGKKAQQLGLDVPIVYIRYSADMPDTPVRVTEALEGREAHLFFKEMRSTSSAPSPADNARSSGSMQEFLRTEARQREWEVGDPRLTLAEDLIRSHRDDIQEVLSQHKSVITESE